MKNPDNLEGQGQAGDSSEGLWDFCTAGMAARGTEPCLAIFLVNRILQSWLIGPMRAVGLYGSLFTGDDGSCVNVLKGSKKTRPVRCDVSYLVDI